MLEGSKSISLMVESDFSFEGLHHWAYIFLHAVVDALLISVLVFKFESAI